MPEGTWIVLPAGSAFASSTAARSEHRPAVSAQMPSPNVASDVLVVMLTSKVPAAECASVTAPDVIDALPTLSTAQNLIYGVAALTATELPTVPFVGEGSEPSVV